MKKVENVDGITNPYVKRILTNVIGQDPLKVLRTTPKRLQKLTKGLKQKQLRFQPEQGKWSIIQIVAHLADTEQVLAFRLRMSLAQPGSPLAAADQDKWSAVLKYNLSDLDDQIELFSVVRKHNFAIWNSLQNDDWQKFGMHEERGRETVELMAQQYAGHDINHLRQIESIGNSFKKKKKK